MTRTKGLLAVIVLLALSAGYADVRVFQISGNVAHYQRANTRALCAFRDDIQRRVTSTASFLLTHPNGFAGIPAATLRVSLHNEVSTLNALRPLVC